MEIKNILKLTCLFLGKENLENITELDGSETSTSAQQKELNFLLRCLNLTYSEIASDYIPLLKTEKVLTTDGKIVFSNLSKNLCEVKSLKDENGFKVNYKLYPDYILADGKNFEITYSYLPEALSSISSTLENFSKKVSEKILAYGTAMEYCFISGLYDDAQIWEKRFKDAILVRSGKKTEIKLPKRRWIWCSIKNHFLLKTQKI